MGSPTMAGVWLREPAFTRRTRIPALAAAVSATWMAERSGAVRSKDWPLMKKYLGE
jgi:hypothetical protein